MLDACLDTAPFGDETVWTYPPTSGEIVDGWLHGRGSADSKTGAAIFAHVVARLRQSADEWAGSVVLLFDADEHTGAFGGAKAFFEGDPGPRTDGVMIGYPGLDHVVTGGRGSCAPGCTSTESLATPGPARRRHRRSPRPPNW